MTLFKQIALVVTMGILVLLTLISWDNFRRSSDFVEVQMQTAAQDVATTLGIAISTTGSGTDVAALETFFNAMFDSGYYSQIRLVDATGNIVHAKQRELSIDDIPDWFIELVPLSPALGTAQIRQGWVNLGTLEVTVHPALAYAELYENLRSSLLWFTALFFAILAVLWFDLHVLLKPLKRVREQARAINENQFIKQSSIPKTLELRSVVEAMNHMTDKVQHIFREQEAALAKYQTQIYTDESTGLSNRKFIMSHLKGLVSESSSFSGHLLVFKLNHLDQVKETKGYDAEVKEIERVVVAMRSLADSLEEATLARLGDDEFALILPGSQSEAEQAALAILDQCENAADDSDPEIDSTLEGESSVLLSAASVSLHSGLKLGSVLSELDMAISQASAAGDYQYRHATSNQLALPEGKMQWRQWLNEKLEGKGFYLVGQPVFTKDKSLYQREVYIRLDDDRGQMVPAGVFMPMAQALRLDLEIDRQVFALMKELKESSCSLALNLSSSFFQRPEAIEEFRSLLVDYRKNNRALSVEASHQVLLQYPEMSAQIADYVREQGHTFGIDNLDLHRSMQALHTVRPNYVKVNGQMLSDLSQSSESGAYQALRTLTTALDIQVIAVGIDQQAIEDIVIELGVDALQGNYLGQSEKLN